MQQRHHTIPETVSRFVRLSVYMLLALVQAVVVASCTPEPPLHLYDSQSATMDLPLIDLNLNVLWDYELAFGVQYDWEAEWYYGWDEKDREIWGDIGYTEPKVFEIRRYFTGEVPYAPHTSVLASTVEGTHFQGRYNWGFWDILVWNKIHTIDGVQSVAFDEQTTLDSVVAYTNQSMNVARYQAPSYTHSFYEPEALFSAYDQAIDINKDLKGFAFDEERNVYVRTLGVVLRPITYIYLTQVIIHHNRGRVTACDGSANLSAMSRSTCVNSGRAGEDPVTVYYNVRMKRDMPYVPYEFTKENGQGATAVPADDATATPELVDIVGGRLMTFGICNHNANLVSRADDVADHYRHYMDVTMQFNNGNDSTFVFDVTDQVRKRYKGGVITVELDMDTVPIPSRKGGSGFNAVVAEPDTVTNYFDI